MDVVANWVLRAAPFMDMRELRPNAFDGSAKRGGLRSLVFHPGFALPQELLRIPQPLPDHGADPLVFDTSGRLFITVGDGGDVPANPDPDRVAQNPGSLQGNILRIDPLPSGEEPHGIPPDNPFVGRSGYRPEIWALGLRHPARPTAGASARGRPP